jgi:hypothetical protein
VQRKIKVPRLCPLVLLVNVGWRQDKALGGEKERWCEVGCCGVQQRKEINVWVELEFCIGVVAL